MLKKQKGKIIGIFKGGGDLDKWLFLVKKNKNFKMFALGGDKEGSGNFGYRDWDDLLFIYCFNNLTK